MRFLFLVYLIIILAVIPVAAGNFQPLFEGHGDIESYIYFRQNADYFIDTELNGAIEAFRYKKFFLTVDLFKETHMGRKYHSNMVFDPTRSHWSFGLTGRIEFEKYFVEAQMHHDCFHDIDRWGNHSVYWNSPRLGFGTLEYLSKYAYHRPKPAKPGLYFENIFDYYLFASFFAPKGGSFQKGHDYKFTMTTNFRYKIARKGRFGEDIEFDNLWVLNTSDKIKRQHGIAFNTTIYGDKGVMVVYLKFWPYDDQSIRSKKDHKFAFGIHLGF